MTEETTQICFSCGEDLDLNADEWWAHSWEEHPAEEKIEESLEHDDFRDWFHENKIICRSCHKEVVAKILNNRAINDVSDKEEAIDAAE